MGRNSQEFLRGHKGNAQRERIAEPIKKRWIE